MVDSHVDASTCAKIVNFEFVDLARLLPQNKYVFEEEHQCLEIINKNGMSFLSPVSEREAAAINLYSKWEQAFRVYSNILTNDHPAKATELIQYMHVIHTTLQGIHQDPGL